ncbi:type IX secretion system sortase PorU [Reichenbachiella sp. 5M10]|uniref:type IX secretion system sortase PorU n=1 Tax=Reichenbachiella sp. 5M10 TaxID=1889772 RepID=UPI00117B9151|nr:type IX secretion system sortase PorU [Reichenbachiella sp. 5M10]
MKKKIEYIVWGLFVSMGLSMPVLAQQNSVLSKGNWYQMAVLEEGVYRVDAELLDQLGIERGSLDPDRLAVYGNSYNGTLPQANAMDRPVDLLENSTYAVGLADGQFDREDYLLFYARSSDLVYFDTLRSVFAFENNFYSDTSFYYLTVKDEAAKRMTERAAGTVSGSASETYWKLSTHELDDSNLLNSGRLWLGEIFNNSQPSRTIEFDATGLVQGSDAMVLSAVVTYKVVTASSFQFALNGLPIDTIQMIPVGGGEYDTQAFIGRDTIRVDEVQGDALSLEVTFSISSGNARGYLDYAHLMSLHSLDVRNGFLSFYPKGEQAYRIISGDDPMLIWDVSTPTDPIGQLYMKQGDEVVFERSVGSRQYVAFEESQIKSPIAVGAIANQNLHGLGAAEVIYVTTRAFETEVQRLANYRTARDGLLTHVVTVDQVYHEFSSGRQDLSALRDFLKYQYDQYGVLKYVTLVGDGSYDYKDRVRGNNNLVPIYESRNSIDPIDTYSSEDFLGFMEEDEGEWVESYGGDNTLELGIGRIPAKTVSEVSAYVNKIIRYETSSLGYGNWRNKLVFVADDGDNNIHQRDANRMANYVDTVGAELNVRKVFLDSYEQFGLHPNQRSPQANAAFLEAISNGTVIVNYTGHGNEQQLADEKIMSIEIIEGLSNRNLLPFFVTATCDFGNYDNPLVVSGGEQILLSAQGGSIGLLASTRPVLASTNYALNLAMYQALLAKTPDGYYPRLGDMIRVTKNTSLSGVRNRNYALLGDASMRLAFPERTVRLTHINDKALGELDSLGALGKYKIRGQVLSGDVTDEGFDGQVTVTILDKPTEFRTLGDESSAQTYSERDVVLFQGKATVNEGVFDLEVIIPKNIDYSFGEGKISFYAVNSFNTLDGHGVFSEVIVGGSVSGAEEDRRAPEMSLYLGNTDFRDGGKVNASTILLARLTDENGINTSKLGFGNDIVLYLDDSTGIALNDYYTADLDTYQAGWVMYPMDNLTKGHHELTLVAFDSYNNRVEETIGFYVSEKDDIELSDVMNYPNPMHEETTFRFSHDRLGEDLEISLSIANLQGQVILSQVYDIIDAPATIDGIIWDGTGANGSKVKKGIYIYSLKVRSRVDGGKAQAFRKLMVLD